MPTDDRLTEDALAQARAALERGALKNAIAKLKELVARVPDYPAAHDLLAGALYFQGTLEEALVHAQKARALAPEDAEYMRGEGTILSALERHDDAVSCLTEALSRAPDDMAARAALGEAFLGQGRAVQAEAQLRQAAAHTSDAPNVHYALGRALVLMDRPAEAESTFRKVLELSPGHGPSLLNLGRTLFLLDRFKGAIEILEAAAAALNRPAEALCLLGECHAQRDSFEAGRQAFNRAKAAAPDDPKVLEREGFFYLNWQKPEHALACFRTAHALDPRSVGALSGLSSFPLDAVGADLVTQIDNAQAGIAAEEAGPSIVLDFARARALDHQGDFEAAWANTVSANQRHRAAFPSPVAPNRGFPTAPPPGWETSADASAALMAGAGLVIIGGMPRSGKSTAETLLGTLRDVGVGYETNILRETLEDLNEEIGLDLIEGFAALPAGYLAAFRNHFARKFAERAGGRPVYTITSPATYLMPILPVIFRALPGARFVFMDRDRFDNALRIFQFCYAQARHGYTYELKAIIGQIDLWRAAKTHWLQVEPQRAMALAYEDMIADPAAALSVMAQFIGLHEPPAGPLALPDDRGCAVPYRAMMDQALKDGD